jgi:predicted NACHT family NTPase
MTDPLISATSSLLVRLIGDIIKTASKSVALEVELLKTPAKIRSLSKKLASYEQVKTIQSPDRPSKISDFFVSPSFVDSDNGIVDAKLVSDFGDSEHPLIEGIAGQGKSIFMRQLLLEEIKLGQRLPILIELRKITSQKNLHQSGIQFLRALGFCRCEDIWTYLLEAEFAVLLLDGYDETPEECRMQLIDDISTLAMTYDQLRMVVTSRPEPSIKSVSCLKTIRICRLNKSKRDAIVKKICDRATASNLIVKLDKNPSLNEIVDTPLFATLLSIVYRAELRLPETVHEFYDVVFQTLLYRHDDQKEGLERPRKTGLGNHMFRMVFENYCFRTSLNAQLRFSQETATEIFAQALTKEGADPLLADKFFTDVTKITCLLVRDGSEYQFLHKSIQEYFSAGYIKRLPEDKAKDFYGRILISPHRITQLFNLFYFCVT